MGSQKRLLGVLDQFTARLAKAPRKLTFRKGLDFRKWQGEFKAKILELLGPMPESVPLNVQVLAEERVTELGDYGIPPFRQQHIVFDSEPYASVPAYLLIPDDMKPGERRPAILNAHGHGPGKSLLVGLAPKSFEPDSDRLSNEAAALFLVKQGYVVLAPDWRPFGERALDAKYCRQGRDACNVTAMSFEYFGFTLLALNIWDARRSIDLLQSLPFVDPNRIGMTGLSYGGTMTTYMTALDARIKAAVVSGYLSTLNDAMSMRGIGNYCGAQYLPGLLNWGDIPDVFGLIAPRPLLIESGTKDDCFVFDDTTPAYEKLKVIYAAAGASDKLDRDVADLPHIYILNKMIPFFRKYL